MWQLTRSNEVGAGFDRFLSNTRVIRLKSAAKDHSLNINTFDSFARRLGIQTKRRTILDRINSRMAQTTRKIGRLRNLGRITTFTHPTTHHRYIATRVRAGDRTITMLLSSQNNPVQVLRDNNTSIRSNNANLGNHIRQDIVTRTTKRFSIRTITRLVGSFSRLVTVITHARDNVGISRIGPFNANLGPDANNLRQQAMVNFKAKFTLTRTRNLTVTCVSNKRRDRQRGGDLSSIACARFRLPHRERLRTFLRHNSPILRRLKTDIPKLFQIRLHSKRQTIFMNNRGTQSTMQTPTRTFKQVTRVSIRTKHVHQLRFRHNMKIRRMRPFILRTIRRRQVKNNLSHIPSRIERRINIRRIRQATSRSSTYNVNAILRAIFRRSLLTRTRTRRQTTDTSTVVSRAITISLLRSFRAYNRHARTQRS